MRWRNVELSGEAQLSIVGSTGRTKADIRENCPDGGVDGAGHRGAAAPQGAPGVGVAAIGVRQTDEMYVVAQADGHPLKPNGLITHEFVRFIAGTALPRVLRHSHATHLLASGVHFKIAQQRLGHATVAIALDLYSHVLPGTQADATSCVDEALQQALHKHRASAKG